MEIPVFGRNGRTDFVVLALIRLLDANEDTYDPHNDADAHVAFVETILKPEKSHTECVRSLIGDNCPVNINIAKNLMFSLVDCANHHLILAKSVHLETSRIPLTRSTSS